jgi:hypothetical protein
MIGSKSSRFSCMPHLRASALRTEDHFCRWVHLLDRDSLRRSTE